METTENKKDSATNETPEISFKEQRIRDLTMIYYSRQDVKKAIYEFSKNRECVPRYYEGFGKRPDNFQFENDILEQVRRGATSFHCSEELWSDPLELSTEMSRKDFDYLRIGWDLLLDIDSPYLEYSKIYAKILVDVLKFHGVENIGVKFSGSKGFHIIIPWRAFPKELFDQETKNMFPEWPRIICQYLAEIIKPKLSEKIFETQSLKELAEKTGKSEEDLISDECLSCHRRASIKYKIIWICNNCKSIGEVIRIETNRRIPKCPECRKPLEEKSRKEIFFCEFCNFSSDKNPEMFVRSKEKTESLINADLILVSPRHLFRMPYSLHEKTALASIVIEKEEIEKFQLLDANPLKVKVKEFCLMPRENEAKCLLLQALDWNEQKEKEESIIQEKKNLLTQNQYPGYSNDNLRKFQGSKEGYKKILITNPSEDIFPPQIRLLLQGVKQDGRKRALFVLISFFKSLGVPDNEIEKRILEWDEKNYQPLKKGYILSQLSWYKRNPNHLPPNFSNSIYRDLGVDKPDSLSMKTKNPVNYAVKKYLSKYKQQI